MITAPRRRGLDLLHEQPVVPIGSPAPKVAPSAPPISAGVRSLHGSVAALETPGRASRASVHSARSREALHRLEVIRHLREGADPSHPARGSGKRSGEAASTATRFRRLTRGAGR